MSVYESCLLAGGLIGGIILGWILRGIIRPFAIAGGQIDLDSHVTCTSTGITVTGSATPNTGSKLLRLYTYLAPNTATTFNGAEDPPPTTATLWDPQTNPFTLTHPVNGMPSAAQRLFVFGGFGTHGHQNVDFTCGSGSGTTFEIGQAVSEPSARQYRLKAGPDTSSELRLALSRGEVILTFDPLRAAGEAVWSEETPAGEPARWRLTVRKAEGTHVAALELVHGVGPAIVWLCRQWHFFAGNRFVADPAHAGQNLPSLEVQPA